MSKKVPMKKQPQPLLYQPETLLTEAQADEANPDEETPEEVVVPPTDEELQDFKEQLKRWLQLDDQIRTLSVAIRERRCAQSALCPKIEKFMKQFGYNDVNAADGSKIKSSVRKTKETPKMKDVKLKLLELENGEDIMKSIFVEGAVKETYKIRRVIPKVSMSLDL
jgi:hypothetical protein